MLSPVEKLNAALRENRPEDYLTTHTGRLVCGQCGLALAGLNGNGTRPTRAY